jgi:hypothetical protein
VFVARRAPGALWTGERVDESEPDQQRPRGLLGALETSLAALELAPVDEALAALLRAYARELDGAAAAEIRARELARTVLEESGGDPTAALYERVHALELALTRRQALERIGARYRDGLVEILGTPRARGAKSASTPGAGDGAAQPAGPPTGPAGSLTRLRLASGDDA